MKVTRHIEDDINFYLRVWILANCLFFFFLISVEHGERGNFDAEQILEVL